VTYSRLLATRNSILLSEINHPPINDGSSTSHTLGMAATVSGSKTVTQNVATHLTAATLTTLLATAVENLTVAQLESLIDAMRRVASGGTPGTTVGALLK
jgi:hypothetical protein